MVYLLHFDIDMLGLFDSFIWENAIVNFFFFVLEMDFIISFVYFFLYPLFPFVTIFLLCVKLILISSANLSYPLYTFLHLTGEYPKNVGPSYLGYCGAHRFGRFGSTSS